MPLHAGQSRVATAAVECLPSIPPARIQPHEGPGRAWPAAELEGFLEPMVAAVVRLAGANAAVVRVVGADGTSYEPLVAVGIPGSRSRTGSDALSAWCNACAESRDPGSACVKNEVCGHDERFSADVLGPVCHHIVAVPLRHRDRPIGTLNLMFEAERPLSPHLTPLLEATGDLLGITLENARLARENLRIRLTVERQSLAGEVHDSLAQGLTYMRMRMSLLRDAIRRGDDLKAHKFWNDVDETLGNSQHRLRELITYFRSGMDPQGLSHALAETSERFFDRTGIALEFVNRVPDLSLPPEREIEVFHIVQEALANICRHAQAKQAKLVVDRDADGYRIVVEDDGVGFAASLSPGEQDESGHYGIAIMHERARRLGGKLVLGSAAVGTRLELHFPAEQAPLGTES